MPAKYYSLPRKSWPKGVENRNRALEWILKRVAESGDDSGVFYFADDDNTYDLRLFEEIRTTERLSFFPIGLISYMPISTPVLSLNGTLLEFLDGWYGNRTFPVDMASFAVKVRHLVKVNSKSPVRMDYMRGYEEDSFLKRLQVDFKDIQFLADNCTKILVWHTKTLSHTMTRYKTISPEKLAATNLGKLLKYWCLYVDNQPCDLSESVSDQLPEPDTEILLEQKPDSDEQQQTEPNHDQLEEINPEPNNPLLETNNPQQEMNNPKHENPQRNDPQRESNPQSDGNNPAPNNQQLETHDTQQELNNTQQEGINQQGDGNNQELNNYQPEKNIVQADVNKTEYQDLQQEPVNLQEDVSSPEPNNQQPEAKNLLADDNKSESQDPQQEGNNRQIDGNNQEPNNQPLETNNLQADVNKTDYQDLQQEPVNLQDVNNQEPK